MSRLLAMIGGVLALGTANLTGEILSVRPLTFANPDLNLLVPRLHLGGSLNFSGRTSFAYAGLTWTFDITPSIFIEASLGGAVHNGETDPIPAHHDALGCRTLFRESASLGGARIRELERHGDRRAPLQCRIVLEQPGADECRPPGGLYVLT